MVSWMTAFALGVVGTTLLPALPGIGWLGGLTGLFFLLRACLARGGFAAWARAAAVPGFLLLGVLWHAIEAHRQIQLRLPPGLEGKDFPVVGHVDGFPSNNGLYQRFPFQVEESANGFAPRRIMLNYYGPQPIEAGQRWRFVIRLNQPHGYANPGSADYEAYLFQQRISGRGYVRDDPGNVLLGQGGSALLRARARIRAWLDPLVQPFSSAGILVALILGDRALITDRQWELLAQTGTSHLVAISGLHIGLVAALFFMVGAGTWRLLPGACLRLPAQRAGAVLAMLAAVSYSAMAGFSLPTQRALVMVSVAMLAALGGIRRGALLPFLAALTLVLVLDPLAPLASGFWLSFCAVGALLLAFYGTRPRRRTRVARWLSAQWAAFVGLLVPLVVWTGQAPLLSPLANLVAIPLVSWAVVPLCLLAVPAELGLPGLGSILLQLADRLTVLLLRGLEIGAGGNPSALQLDLQGSGPAALLLAGLGAIGQLVPVRMARVFGAMLLAGAFAIGRGAGQPPLLELDVLDVGQGLAVVLRTAGHTLVYDTGPGSAGAYDSGKGIIGPFLRSVGVDTVDLLMVSHGDSDHRGGVAGLAATVRIERLMTNPAPAEGLPGDAECVSGAAWRWDGVEFLVLHPPPGLGGTDNNLSCVLLVTAGRSRLLLPGDIEAAVERRLLQDWAGTLDIDFLVAPHHGSNTSSTSAFLAATSPELAVFSAGYRNRFRHPAAAVQERYRQAAVTTLLTARDGAVHVRVRDMDSGISWSVWRTSRKRYWHWTPAAPAPVP